jgi:hypothetical protein
MADMIAHQSAAAIDAALTAIAYKHMGFQTLERRKMDALDFRDVACWTAKAALEAAYEAGRAAPREVGPGIVKDGMLTVQQAWEWAGGNPGIRATKEDLRIALQALDKVCDEADSGSMKA